MTKQILSRVWVIRRRYLRDKVLEIVSNIHKNPKKSPLPWWEGMVGRANQI
jgi:hypothetical protein